MEAATVVRIGDVLMGLGSCRWEPQQAAILDRELARFDNGTIAILGSVLAVALRLRESWPRPEQEPRPRILSISH